MSNMYKMLTCHSTRLVVVVIALVCTLSISMPAKATPPYEAITINARRLIHDTNGNRVSQLIYNPPSSTDYIADTLCNEWFCSWNDNALWAAAIIIRSKGFWEMSWRYSNNCHGASTPQGYFNTQSSDWEGPPLYDFTDQNYIPGTATSTSLRIVGGVPDYHIHTSGNDYLETGYGSDMQQATQDYATGTGRWSGQPPLDWRSIIHRVYDNQPTLPSNVCTSINPGVVIIAQN